MIFLVVWDEKLQNLAVCGSRKLSHPVRFNDMAMIRVQSRAVRAISLMETFRRYEHRIGPLG